MSKEKFEQQVLLLAVLAAGTSLGGVIGFVIGWLWMYEGGIWAAADKWQTLIGALIAFIASLMILLTAIYSDIKSKKAKLSVARAFLSHSISNLNSYINRSLDCYFEVLQNIRRPDYDPSKLSHQMPVLDNSAFDDIRTVMEFADIRVSRMLKSIVSDMQVLNSRIGNVYWTNGRERADGIDETYILYCVSSVAIVGVNLNNLYDYARGKTEFKHVPVTYSGVNSVLRSCGFGLHFLANQDLDTFLRNVLSRRDRSRYGAFE